MAGLLAAADFADELRSSRGGAPAGLKGVVVEVRIGL